MKTACRTFMLIFFSVLTLALPAQNDSLGINRKRLNGILITEGALWVTSMAGLYSLWYSDYPQSSFHFFNDNSEWLQMDKCGHATTSYYISKIGFEGFRWAGVDQKKSALYGGGLGFSYLAIIEILDGFSSEWGFSVGDFTANTLGSALFVGQQLAWNEQRVLLKYSFHQTKYSDYRPNQLGSNLLENTIKDYNGQTYWLSANVYSFLPKENRFPKWLNIAVGYGAEGMTGADYNPDENNGKIIPHFQRHRQFYLSGDIDLTHIKTHSEALKILFNTIGFIKFPFPAIECSDKGKIRFHPLYF